MALATVAQSVERCPVQREVAGSLLIRAQAQVAGFIPCRERVGGGPCFSLIDALPFPLNIIFLNVF